MIKYFTIICGASILSQDERRICYIINLSKLPIPTTYILSAFTATVQAHLGYHN